MLSEYKVNEVLTTLYKEVMNEIDFENETAKRGELQWSRISEDERLMASYAYEASRNIFLRRFREARRTSKN